MFCAPASDEGSAKVAADGNARAAKRLVKKVRELHTHHDPYGLHKLVGFAVLLHFAYRFVSVARTGSMGFSRHSWSTLLFFALHGGLSLTALQFKTPVRRHAGKPMMYREFQLHSVCFAFRSVLVGLLLCTGFARWRGFAAIGVHLAADQVTARFKQGTTMRSMPWPKGTSERAMRSVNYFYSLSQLFATLGCMRANLEGAFFILFPIQIAAFELTLVRKDIISARTWHAVYGGALSAGYAYLLLCVERPHLEEIVALGLLVLVLRFALCVNKYAIWIPLALYIAMRVIDDAECDFLWSTARYVAAFQGGNAPPEPLIGSFGTCSAIVLGTS